eukprot:15330230-Ditylum_brightwellii.AAC.1
MGFGVLSQLGVRQQSSLPDTSIVLRDIIKLKLSLQELTGAELLNYKEMKDNNMIAAMSFLQLLLIYSLFAMPEYFLTITFQMLHLTLSYGICEESCSGLTSLSVLLCQLEDFNGSERIGHLAILLLEKFKSRKYASHVYCGIFGVIRGWNRHIKLSIEPLLSGYKIGMQTGDIQMAMFNAYIYLTNNFISGQRHLSIVRKDLNLFGEQMVEYKQMVMNHLILPIQQVVSNLLLSTGEPPIFVGKDEEQERILAQASSENNRFMASQIFIFGVVEAYIFGDYELAAALVQKRREIEQKIAKKSCFYGMTEFFDGLTFLAMAHQSNDEKWILSANNSISNVERYAKICPSNCEHKLLLLQAEMNSAMGEVEEASSKYELAVSAAERNEFIHEQAIANERAAEFFLRHDDPRACYHYSKAQSLFLKWGAQGKVDHLLMSIDL